MQEHIYTAKTSRIFGQSFFIWMYVAIQIVFSIFVGSLGLTKEVVMALIFGNLLLGAITIPAVLLFLKYYKYSVGKKFVVTYDSLKLIDEKKDEIIEIKSSEITSVCLIENRSGTKLPWIFHSYFYFIDDKQNMIVVTSYFMEIHEFWMDTLRRKVKSEKLIRIEKIYPSILEKRKLMALGQTN